MDRTILSLTAVLSISGGAISGGAISGGAAAFEISTDLQCARMVATIRDLAAAHGPEDRRQIDPDVLEIMGEVPRHLFVPEAQRPSAYENRPLPIGYEQTISQPYVVAVMTDLLGVEKDDVVLEIGTGSGYQTAILSRLVRRVYTIEIVAPLAMAAEERLRELGYRNITVRRGDGYAGWPERGPFDGIMVTAGAKKVPPPLLRQLKPGGRMVIPVGSSREGQKLLLIEKRSNGQIRSRDLGAVLFVPLTGAGHER